MRISGYYAWHSFKNQIKKIFKTWVLIFFLVCVLVGGALAMFVFMAVILWETVG